MYTHSHGPESPMPGYMLRDSRWGHQIPGHNEAHEKRQTEDRAFAQEFIEMAEAEGFYVEVGTFAWSGMPVFAAMMSQADHKTLTRAKTHPRPAASVGGPDKLGWAVVKDMPGFANNRYWLEDALEQAFDNYFAHEAAQHDGVQQLPTAQMGRTALLAGEPVAPIA